jgi:predicted  nucleic acid-binding Zn-ribbon protein
VFGLPATPDEASLRDTSHPVPLKPSATSNETSELRIELATMRERATALERENTLLRDDREQSRHERERLLRIVEEQSGQLRLLTDQRQTASPSLPWWRRLARGSRT